MQYMQINAVFAVKRTIKSVHVLSAEFRFIYCCESGRIFRRFSLRKNATTIFAFVVVIGVFVFNVSIGNTYYIGTKAVVHVQI